jgi:hypothetical protein
MKIKLLKSFALVGFNFKIENGDVVAMDNNGNNLKDGIDYTVEKKKRQLQ